jgi:hypothetical protein
MKLAAISLLLLTGCTPDVPPLGTYAPAISVALGLAAQPGPGPAPKPEPGPKPGSKCENCDGTGRLGDGRVSVDCPVCIDGIVPPAIQPAIQAKQPRTGTSAPVRASAPAPAAATPTGSAAGVRTPAPRVVARVAYVCGPDGKCRQVICYAQ